MRSFVPRPWKRLPATSVSVIRMSDRAALPRSIRAVRRPLRSFVFSARNGCRVVRRTAIWPDATPETLSPTSTTMRFPRATATRAPGGVPSIRTVCVTGLALPPASVAVTVSGCTPSPSCVLKLPDGVRARRGARVVARAVAALRRGAGQREAPDAGSVGRGVGELLGTAGALPAGHVSGPESLTAGAVASLTVTAVP